MSAAQCQDISFNEPRLKNTTTLNVIVVMTDVSFQWSTLGRAAIAGDSDLTIRYTELDWNPIQYRHRRWEIEYCYAEVRPVVAQFTIRWLPMMVVGVAIVVKGISSRLALRILPHFQQRVFNSLGDMLWLSAEHPELASFTPLRSELQIIGRRKIKWYQQWGPVDHATFVFWWACILRMIWLGSQGMAYLGTDLSVFSGAQCASSGIVTHNLGMMMLANIPKVWVAVSYFVWNNQISRMWMEREWGSYFQKRRRPRVTYETHDRGTWVTYWLQIPFSISTILFLIGVALNWVASNALKIVELVDKTQYDSWQLNCSPGT